MADTTGTIYALTSLSPARDARPRQLAAIQSWRAAGLAVRCFNRRSEIKRMRDVYDVDFVPLRRKMTSKHIFGRPYVPINVLLDWARAEDVTALLINSDIEFHMSLPELQRIRDLSDGGLCYFIRYNYAARKEESAPDPWGIDAFLLHGRDASLVPASFLSMGQPWWDYWLPLMFIRKSRPVYSVEFPAIFHRNHPQNWSLENYQRCALEFDRLVPMLGKDRSMGACQEMAGRVRPELTRRRRSILRIGQQLVVEGTGSAEGETTKGQVSP